LKKQISEQEPEIKAVEKRLEKSMGKLDDTEKKMQQCDDKVFKDFCNKAGFGSVREYENKFVLQDQQSAEQRLKITKEQAKVRSKLDYEKARDLKKPIERKQKEIGTNTKNLQELEKQRSELEDQLKAEQDKVNDFKETVSGLKKTSEQIETQIREARKQVDKARNKADQTKKQIAGIDTQIDGLRSRRHTVFQTCRMEEVNLPCIGEMPSTSNLQHSDIGMMEASQDTSQNSSQQPNASQVRRDREEREEEASAVIDYDGLAKEYKRLVADMSDYDAVNNSFVEKQKSIASQIDKMTPNMKAHEHLADVNKRLESLNDDLAKARDDSTSAADLFVQTKTERRERFMSAFDHLSKRIDQIYKDLTKSKKFPHGGQANLTLEETEEPYLGGIKYHAMPPNKRFRDMEQLSGGEKTLAALALLFAIHSYQPSPFFVLDEIDDALDQDNVVTVANYIRQRRVDLQSIVISLKETFYEKADALVGICKDMANWRTNVYTVDLTNYEE